LKQLGFHLMLDNEHLGVKGFVFKTGNSEVATNVNLQYPSISDFLNHPDKSHILIDLNHFSLDLNDAFQLQPDLRNDTLLNNLSRQKMAGRAEVKGSLAELKLPEFVVTWGDSTHIKAHGEFQNLANIDSAKVAIDNFSLETNRKDITALIPEEELGISVPEKI